MKNAASTNDHVIQLKDEQRQDPNANPSPHAHELGGALGMAAVGVAGGILAGVTAGAAIGGIAGPIGAIAGAAIGGAVGGAAGEEVARELNPTLEEVYWEKNFRTRPYSGDGQDFANYRSAYRVGIDGYMANPKQSFESLEPSLRNNWNIARGDSKLEWEEARHAAQDAFSRLATPNAR